jgi:O-acetyl-ADP-ribose deacetylase (regulator of RNase III)
MPTTFTKGDIFNTQGLTVYAHGCNCAGAMDSGVAVAFKKRFPQAFEEYRKRCEDGRFSLGDVFVWSDEKVTVYHLAIQEHWKTKTKMPALVRALGRMIEAAEKSGIKRIAMPRVGAGLGGLEWHRVRDILTELGSKTMIEIVVFEQFVRAKDSE